MNGDKEKFTHHTAMVDNLFHLENSMLPTNTCKAISRCKSE